MRVVDAYPLTALQAGMVFHSECDRGLPTYRDVCSVLTRGPFDEDAFRLALAHAVACHEVLRTGFDLDGFDEPVQLVYDDAEIQLKVDDLRGAAEAEQKASLERRVRAASEMVFRWSRPPLICASAQVLSEETFRLTLCFHHAILDGWSVATLLADIMRAYAVNLGLACARLPRRPAATFRAYVAAEKASLTSEETIRYWRESAERCSTSRPTWRAPSARPLEVATITVAPSDLRALLAFGERFRVPLKSIFLAIHLRTLSALTHRPSVTTGVITNTRLEEEDGDRVLGLFINTLPFRIDVGNASWGTVIQRVFDVECESLPHRRYPLAAIQRAAGVGQLFSTVFGYQQYHQWAQVSDETGLAVEDVQFFERTNYPLVVSASRSPSGDDARILLKYHPDIVSAQVIARMTSLIREAVREVASSPSEAPRPSTATPCTNAGFAGPPVHETIACFAARRPDAISLRTDDRRLTYAQLDRRANQLARRLIARGLERHALVALVLDLSIELVLLQLAVWRAGTAFVLIDPADPAARKATILADSQPSLVLTDGPELRELFESALAESDAALPSAQQDPSAAAYVLYTSGSTGTPKGVVVPHIALSNVLSALADLVELRAQDVLLAVTTPAFDISLLELFMPLVVGATVILASRADLADPHRLSAILDNNKVTVMQATPWRWRLMVDCGWTGKRDLTILCGGDALTVDLAEALLGRGSSLWNLYGPTETAIWCSARRVHPGFERVDIGAPLRGLHMSVHDANGLQVRSGASGELWIGGIGVARGYLNRPEETAARFVTLGADRLYRTGDIARALPDGSFELIGRADDQIKIFGFRVELGEVAAALLAHPGVRDAHVSVNQDEASLVAHVVLTRETSVQSLTRAIAETLPRYMLPSYYVVLDRLPRLPNGKIDRRALSEIRPPTSPPAPPRNAIEEKVLSLWKEVLRQNRIGIHDEFTHVGGDSIGALRLVARIEKVMGRRIPLSTFVDRATVATVATVAAYLADAPAPRNSESYAVRMTKSTIAGAQPLFLVHPLGGHVFSFRHLADALALQSERPVYCLRACGLEPQEKPLSDVREMARLYLDAIRAAQPTGPYAIAGWCMGGVISFEIATQLLADGERVRFLGILSAPIIPSLPEGIALKKHVLAQHIELDISQFDGLSEDEQIQRIIDRAKHEGWLRPDVTDLESARRLIAMYEAHSIALRGYQPVPYPGSAVYFSPIGSRSLGEQHIAAWRKLVAGAFEVEWIAGDQYDFIMNENANGLASRLTKRLSA